MHQIYKSIHVYVGVYMNQFNYKFLRSSVFFLTTRFCHFCEQEKNLWFKENNLVKKSHQDNYLVEGMNNFSWFKENYPWFKENNLVKKSHQDNYLVEGTR